MLTAPHLKTLVPNVDHAEGIAWHAQLRSLFFGTEGGELFRYTIDTEELHRVASVSGFLLGVAIGADGEVFACDATAGVVHRWNPRTNECDQYFSGTPKDPLRVPNFVVPAARGGMYVTDSGSCWDRADGTIWYVDHRGRGRRATSYQLAFPNGMALTPDGRALLCLETYPARLLRFSVREDGNLGEPEPLCSLGNQVPDGLAIAPDGALHIACYRPDAILRSSREDWTSLQLWVADPYGKSLAGPSNLCFFGDRLDRLAVANVGGTWITEVVPDTRSLKQAITGGSDVE